MVTRAHRGLVALASLLACTGEVAPIVHAGGPEVAAARVEAPPPLSAPTPNASDAAATGAGAGAEGEPAPVGEPSTPAAADADHDHDNDSDDATCDLACAGGDLRGDDLLTAIDRGHGLAPTWEPTDLVALDPPYVIGKGSPPNLVRRAAADAFVALSDAALIATGVRINIRSGYRSFALQCGIFKDEVARTGCAEARRSSARAGFSEHQLGTTVDVAIGWRRLDGGAPIDVYLRDHAHDFGWVVSYPEGSEAITGYKHEPWHLRYLGVAAARDQIARADGERRITTEEFLRARRPADPRPGG